MYQRRFFLMAHTHWHNEALHCSAILVACLLSVKSRSPPPKTATRHPRTSFPLSPLACHSAFLSGDLATGFNLSELFRPFQTCDICSIQVSTIPLSHSLLVSTHILDRPCHIFVPLGISAPDLNFDVFCIVLFFLIFLRIPKAAGMFGVKGYKRY